MIKNFALCGGFKIRLVKPPCPDRLADFAYFIAKQSLEKGYGHCLIRKRLGVEEFYRKQSTPKVHGKYSGYCQNNYLWRMSINPYQNIDTAADYQVYEFDSIGKVALRKRAKFELIDEQDNLYNLALCTVLEDGSEDCKLH